MKTKKRYVSLLLALCLVVGMITISKNNVIASDQDKAIMAGISGISAQTDCVYFGTYLQSSDGTVLGYVDEPIKWQTLSEENGKLLLVSDQNLDMKQYYTSEVAITWENSTLRSWMNGNFYADAFNLLEKEAVAETKVVNADNSEYGIDGGNGTIDKVFALSIDEAKQYFPDNASRIATNTVYAARRGDGVNAACEADIYYLRSPGCLTSRAAVVTASGKINEEGRGLSVFTIGARPAFNMDLNAVLFTSAAIGGKAVSGMEGGLKAIGTEYSGNEWKATILDASRDAFEASALATNDTTWTVEYEGATTGENEYLSVMIADEDGVYTHYGRLENLIDESQKSGTVEINLAGIEMTGKTLYVFNEQYNGGANDDTKLTDCASEFVRIAPITKITWSDFEKDSKTSADQAFVKGAFDDDCYIANLKSTACDMTGNPIEKLNATDFAVNVMYTACGDSICYGGTDSTKGLQISVTEDENLSVEPLGLKIKPEDAKVTSFLNNEITLRITTKYGDYDGEGDTQDAQLGIYFDGNLYNNEYCYAYDTQLTENVLAVNVASKGILLRSVPNTKEAIHNLTKGNYMNIASDFAGAHKVGEYLVSDIVSAGLGISGDFLVCDTEDKQIGKLIVYNEKDTHPDGEVDVRDLVAMKKVKSGLALSTWSGTMGAYATDFDGTGIVDVLLDQVQ